VLVLLGPHFATVKLSFIPSLDRAFRDHFGVYSERTNITITLSVGENYVLGRDDLPTSASAHPHICPDYAPASVFAGVSLECL
jgi:hypothetical protein